jgi:AbrB family looped-hinge helix DNA binding protein
MAAAILNSTGRMTIPKSVRDQLNLKPGDRLEFLVQPDGRVLMIPAIGDVRELKGILPKPKRKLGLREIASTVGDAATARRKK